MKHFKSAAQLHKELGITDPQYIDIEAIAYHCGILVQYRNLDGCAARLVGQGDTAIVSVERSTSLGRKRFSIGHEIGHWMRDRGKGIFLCQNKEFRSRWGSERDPETLANEYAASLLLPWPMFKPRASGKPIIFETVEELSEEFRVSRTAVSVRLVESGLLPAMIVCHGQEGRRWYRKGPELPDFLHPHRELSHYTDAFELLFGKKTETRPATVPSDEWINLRNADRYSVVEHSFKFADDAIITLIWWKDESQLDDLN